MAGGISSSYGISGSYGSWAGYVPSDQRSKHLRPYPPSAPETFAEFKKAAWERVTGNLSDGWGWLHQLGFAWAGDAIGYTARIGLRAMGTQYAPLLLGAQILSDIAITGIYTSRYRQGDEGFAAWRHETTESAVARVVLMGGMHLLRGVIGKGFVATVLASGALLAIGGMLGERLSHALGSQTAIGPGGVYGFLLRMIDAQTTSLKGGLLKGGMRKVHLDTPWAKHVRLDSDEIGRVLEKRIAMGAPETEQLARDRARFASHREELARASHFIKMTNRVLAEQGHDLRWNGRDICGDFHEADYFTALRPVLDIMDAAKTRPPAHPDITPLPRDSFAPDPKDDAYFEYLAEHTSGLREFYRIADREIARKVFREDDPRINLALAQGKLPLTYLDGGASTKALPSVEHTHAALLRHYANTHGNSHNPLRISDFYYHLAHDIALEFAGYKSGELGTHTAVFVGQGTTDAINHAVRLLFEKRSFKTVTVSSPASARSLQAWRSAQVVLKDFAASLKRGAGLIAEGFGEMGMPFKRLANRLVPGVNIDDARDTVIFCGLGHHANIIPWQVHGKNPVAIPLPAESITKTPSVEAFRQAIRDHRGRVKLVAITGVSNVTGFISNIKEITQLAHEEGAMILVDGAHLFSHALGAKISEDSEPLNLAAMGVDFVATSGHKIYAPGAPGLLIMPKALSPDIPVRLGGGIVKDVYPTHARFSDEFPGREQAGTPPIPNAVDLVSSLLTLQAIGMQRVWDHEQHLTRQAVSGLTRIPGVTVHGDTDLDRTPRAGVVSFEVDGLSHNLVSAALSDYFNIATRAGCFCAQPYVKGLKGISGPEEQALANDMHHGDWRRVPGMVRASFGVYTTPTDIHHLVDAVREIAENKAFFLDKYTLERNGAATHKEAAIWGREQPAQVPILEFPPQNLLATSS